MATSTRRPRSESWTDDPHRQRRRAVRPRRRAHSTATLHAACWKEAFDPLLPELGQPPFDAGREYLDHVDGKPGAAGMRDLLRSRPARARPARGGDRRVHGGRHVERERRRAPDGFRAGAARLDVPAGRAVVVEDPLAGVAAAAPAGSGS
jgi:beta-phosphoglucomutase-like phosphatase (HAD superfamily)